MKAPDLVLLLKALNEKNRVLNSKLQAASDEIELMNRKIKSFQTGTGKVSDTFLVI